MNHKGITQYSGEFASNLTLGQAGFKFINSTSRTFWSGEGTSGPTTIYHKDVNQWVAIKNVTDPNSGLNTNGAITVDIGTYIGESGTSSTVRIHLAAGDIVYGPFKSVKIDSGTDAAILAYIG
jgi:hypothetical protein